MKILAIGDFHGKFPKDLKDKCKKADLVVSVGDYCPFSLRKEFFKYVYKKEDRELFEFIGKEKIKKATIKDLKQGEVVLRELNNLGKPVITVTGNLDYTKWKDAYDPKSELKWKWSEQDFFSSMIKKYKGIKCFDYSFLKIGELIFIGMAKSTFPGKVKSKEYKKLRGKLEKLFKQFSRELKENKVIFVSHNVPYDTKLDLIKDKNAEKEVKGKHYGSKLVRRLIKKYQPLLAIAGHMHECQGKDKIGKTVLVNTGSAHDDQAVLIDVDEDAGKLKEIKFYGKKKK